MNPRWSLFAISFTALYTLSTLAIVFGFEANIQKEKGGLSPQIRQARDTNQIGLTLDL
jgi:hypothetical protein